MAREHKHDEDMQYMRDELARTRRGMVQTSDEVLTELEAVRKELEKADKELKAIYLKPILEKRAAEDAALQEAKQRNAAVALSFAGKKRNEPNNQ